MPAYERRTLTGGAVATTVSSSIAGGDTSIPITASTGWPTGSVGPFGVIIDRGLATEEKVLIASRASLTLTVASGGRGVDGTTGVAHSSGAVIEVVMFARDLDEANAHLSDVALDHHTQYLNTTRHDVEARHAFGGALGTPSAAADIGTAAATGSGDDAAREDHVHKIGAGAINSAGMFAAGVVDAAAIATDAVTSAEILAGAVGTAELASDAVTTIKILDANVTTPKILDANVTTAKIANLGVTAGKLAADAVITAKILDANVTTAKLANASVTAAKLATGYDKALISGIDAGTVANGTEGDDAVSVSYGVTFASAPVVTATVQAGSNIDLVLNIEATPTTTGFVYRVVTKDGTNVSGNIPYGVHWHAHGTLA